MSLQREKDCGAGREKLGAGFAMGDPLISLCVAHTLRLENRSLEIDMQTEGKKLPDGYPGMREQQRGWAEVEGKGCMKPLCMRSVFKLPTGMQNPKSRKTNNCIGAFS